MENNPVTPNNPTPSPNPTPASPISNSAPASTPTPTPISPTPAPIPTVPTPTTSTPTVPDSDPASGPVSTPTSTPVPAAPISNSATPLSAPTTPKKKLNKPLIIGASVAAALLVGGAVAFAIYRTQPEVVALDAISGLLRADNIASSGSIDITSASSTDSSVFGIKSAVINFDSKVSDVNNIIEATATVTMSDDSTVSLNFGEAFMSDGKLYLKIDGIKKAIAALPQEYADSINQYFDEVIDRVDGIWWEVYLDDILEASKDSIPETAAKQIRSVHDCSLQTLNEVSSSDEFSNLYKDHRFLKVENYTGSNIQATNGGSLYSISLDNDALANFVKGIGNTQLVNNFTTCINNIEGLDARLNASDSFKDIDADDFASLSNNLPELVLEANSWTHTLNAFHVYNSTGLTIKADLNFTYGSASITAPDGAKNILDITDLIADGDASYLLFLVPGVNFMLPLIQTDITDTDEFIAPADDADSTTPDISPSDDSSSDDYDDEYTDNDYYDDSDFTDEETEIWDESSET